MRIAKKFLVASMLPLLTVAACSNDSTTEPSGSASMLPRTTADEPTDAGDDPGEANGATRIPLGRTTTVPVPADAVLDIKGLAEWDRSALRCTATTASGEPLELLAPDPAVQPEDTAQGGTWIPLWTVAAAPGEAVIGCTAVDDRIPNETMSFVRIVPRGLMPGMP